MSVTDAPQAVEEFVDAFEAVRHRQAVVDLLEFVPSRTHPHYRDVVVELIRVDLEHCWQQGAKKSIADYQAIFADVLSDSQYLEPIAFEEYRLRRIAGERVTRRQFEQKYHLDTQNWPELPLGEIDELAAGSSQRLGLLSSSADLSNPSRALLDAGTSLPEVGDRFLEFELVSELGRGALGRVYLARQGDLARRFVALKITARGCDEAQHLAQLQHTNIVPIYSFHTYESLQAVCMPFLGRRTLADVVHSFRCGQPFPASGQALIGTLGVHVASTLSTEQTAEEQAAAIESQYKLLSRTEVVRRMEQMTFIDAAAWMVSRVADGLAHAHEHGIVHRDLKPANILVSDDGEPLILDFHLSAHQPAEAVIGGTLPYMSVEQLTALIGGGEIGRKSDIYSLGVILFELLTGTTPYPIRFGSFPVVISQMLEDRKQPAPSVRQFNKRVSCDLESIVKRCLSSDVNQRYDSARQLHEDLVRHLEHRPLRHAPNRSVVERSRKWMHRHPRIFSASSIAIVACCAIVALGISLTAYSQRLAAANAREVKRDVHDELFDARAALNMEFIGEHILKRSVARARVALEKPGILSNGDIESISVYTHLDEAGRRELKADSAELLYLLASGTGRLAHAQKKPQREKMFSEALRFNELARRALNEDLPSQAMASQRTRLKKLAANQGAENHLFDKGLPSSSDPRSLRLLSYEAAEHRDFHSAIGLLEQLKLQQPQDPGVWMSLGNCYLSLQQFEDAKHCFDVAIALQRDCIFAYELRGFARLGLKEFKAAIVDFSHAIEHQPDSILAYVNRSVARRELGDIAGAIHDLSTAMKFEGHPTRLYFMRAELKRRLDDPSGAEEDRLAGLKLTPEDDLSWIARGHQQLPANREAALEDFKKALEANPQSNAARQNLAYLFSELNRPAEAIDVLDEMLKLDPSDVGALVSRGVLHARMDRRDEAIADAEAAAQLGDQPLHVYQQACVYALSSRQHRADADRAIQLIANALKSDVGLCQHALTDPDLDPIRMRPEFQSLVRSAQILQQVQ